MVLLGVPFKLPLRQKSFPKPDCRDVRGQTLYEVASVVSSKLDLMLRELVSWDAATDTSSDYPDVMTDAMLAELLLAPHNMAFSGLSFGAWMPIDAADDPGTCRCVKLKEVQHTLEKHAIEVFNKGEEGDHHRGGRHPTRGDSPYLLSQP